MNQINQNQNIFDLIKEKVKVIDCLSKQLDSWEQELRANYGVDTITASFLPDCTFHYTDQIIQNMEQIDELEFDETCTRNMIAQEQVSEIRNLQKTFRIEFSILVSKIVSAPKRMLQRAKNMAELREKEQFVEKWIGETCPITQFPIVNPLQSICCKKIFNKMSFDKWIEKEFSCPTCRKPIKKEKNQYIILPEPVQKKVEEVMFTTPCCRRTIPIAAYNLALQTSNGYCPICRHDIFVDLYTTTLMQAFLPQQARATSAARQ
jgi:hypothetical protein